MIDDKPLIAAEHAFNLPDPTPKLLELIHAEPTLSTINATSGKSETGHSLPVRYIA
jgi:hypothetical protein